MFNKSPRHLKKRGNGEWLVSILISDDTPEDPGLTGTSTRSLLSASSSAHDNSALGIAGSTTAVATSTTSTGTASITQLYPRRSASGGFIGPADADITSLSSASAASRPTIDQPSMATAGIACSGSTHFALISGPYSWPKNLLRQPQGQDSNALMSWTKVCSTMRRFFLLNTSFYFVNIAWSAFCLFYRLLSLNDCLRQRIRVNRSIYRKTSSVSCFLKIE